MKIIYGKDSWIRTYTITFLEEFSIFETFQAGKDEDYKKELKKAIEFSKIAAQELHEILSN